VIRLELGVLCKFKFHLHTRSSQLQVTLHVFIDQSLRSKFSNQCEVIAGSMVSR
jgi:hypothetical protein